MNSFIYRIGSLKGCCAGFLYMFRGLKAADYTTLWYRITGLVWSIPCESMEPVVVAVDSTGLKVTNRGDWLGKNSMMEKNCL